MLSVLQSGREIVSTTFKPGNNQVGQTCGRRWYAGIPINAVGCYYNPPSADSETFTFDPEISRIWGIQLVEKTMSDYEMWASYEAYTLAQEQKQLQAKTAMLQSPTATWGSKEAYKAEVAETTAEIRNYNAEIAAVLATAPEQQGITDDALLSKPQMQNQPATAPGGDNNIDKAIVIAAGLVAGIALLAITGGRK